MGEETAKEGLRKIFVGGLNRGTTDEKFRSYFQQFGTIVDLVIIKDSHTKKSKGFGFVTYENVDAADNALAARPHTLDDWEVDIKRAIPREQNTDTAHQRTNKLFLGGLPSTANEADIMEYFHQTYPGKGTIEKCDLIKNKATGVSRGFAFLELNSEDFADLIIIDNATPNICGKKVEIKKAEDRRGGGGGQGRGNQGRGGMHDGGYGRNGNGPQTYRNDYDDYGRDPYAEDPGIFPGNGNVFYPNVGYSGYGPMPGQDYGTGYGNPYGDFGGGYGNGSNSGYGPMRSGGPRRGGGSQRGGRPY